MKRFIKEHKETIIEATLWCSVIFEVAVIIAFCILSEVYGSHESDPAVYERYLEEIERGDTKSRRNHME